MPQGQIRKALSGFYYVYAQGKTYQTRARGNFRQKKITPLVGDEVVFESSNLRDGYLLEILPRKNELVRPPVANIDHGIVVTSCVTPDFSPQLLDRFLVTLHAKKITPLIYITKTDLLEKTAYEAIIKLVSIYQKIGYQVFFPNQSDGQETTQKLLENTFKDKISVLMGQSGAGKSTLLNAILPTLALETGEISESLGRGRHTTRAVSLMPVAGGLVADTPGFGAIDLNQIEPERLADYFPEMAEVSGQCQFRGCLHVHEPNCAVKTAVEQQKIAISRYDNYLYFLTEIQSQKPRYDKKHQKKRKEEKK